MYKDLFAFGLKPDNHIDIKPNRPITGGGGKRNEKDLFKASYILNLDSIFTRFIYVITILHLLLSIYPLRLDFGSLLVIYRFYILIFATLLVLLIDS